MMIVSQTQNIVIHKYSMAFSLVYSLFSLFRLVMAILVLLTKKVMFWNHSTWIHILQRYLSLL